MNKKQVVLFHGMSCHMDEIFGKSLKSELLGMGYEIIEPLMTLHPNISLEKWFEEAEKFLPKISNNAIYVCHSLGTNFVLKFLAKNNLKAKATIAVAGGYVGKNTKKHSYLDTFVPTDEEIKYFISNCENRFNIFCESDHIWSKEELANFNNYFQAQPIKLESGGHFGRSSGTKQIPEISKIIKSL